jgi:tryptophan-rich sensory protein
LFFAWRRADLAFADIVLLIGLVVATALAFARVRVLAAVLLLPYLAWITFATALTRAVWKANQEQLSG